MKGPKNLVNWQKKYGPGFVCYSTKTGRVKAYGKNIKVLYEMIKKKKIDRQETSILYIPGYKSTNVFQISLPILPD